MKSLKKTIKTPDIPPRIKNIRSILEDLGAVFNGVDGRVILKICLLNNFSKVN